jgi:hypothetical protein
MTRLIDAVAVIALAGAAWTAAAQQPADATLTADAGESRAMAKTATCADVAIWIKGVLRTRAIAGADNSSLMTFPREISPGNLRPYELDCGAMPGFTPGVALELTKIFYDRALHSWEFLVRCAAPADCLPFLVRWPQPAAREPLPRQALASARVSSISPAKLWKKQHVLLRPGETATLVWDQDGIRVVLPVICLDQGNVGDSIRVRIKSGSRVLRAEIINESLLRVIL